LIARYYQAAICTTRSVKGQPGHHLVDRVHEQMNEAHRPHGNTTLEMRWTPSHEGIEGNECLDEEAKMAVRKESALMPSYSHRQPKSALFPALKQRKFSPN